MIISDQIIQNLHLRVELLEIILEEINPNVIVLTVHEMKDNEIERLSIDVFLGSAHGIVLNQQSNGVFYILSKMHFK